MDGAEYEYGYDERKYQQSAWQDTACEQFGDAHASIESIHDEHDGRRNDHAQRGTDGDAAAFELFAVTSLRHGWQRHAAHGGGRCGVGAADGGEACGREKRRYRQTTALFTEPCFRSCEKAFAVASMEHRFPKQHEQRNDGEAVIGEDTPYFHAGRSRKYRVQRDFRHERDAADSADKQHGEARRHACEEDEKQHHEDAEKTEKHFRVHFASSFDSVGYAIGIPPLAGAGETHAPLSAVGNTTSLRMDVTTPLRSPLVSASVSGSFRVSR